MPPLTPKAAAPHPADRTRLPVPSPWAPPYGPPLGHFPMPTMGYPFPPVPFLPSPYPSRHPMGYPPPCHPGPSHKSTQREKQRLPKQNPRPRTPAQKKKPKLPPPTSPQRRKRSRSTGPKQNTRPRKPFTMEVARSVKRPGHCDPRNTPGYNKGPPVALRGPPEAILTTQHIPRGKLTIMLEPDPPANPRFRAYRAPIPPKPNDFLPLLPRPDPRPQPPCHGPPEITGGGYGLARSRH